eukprot:4300495-Alexandrium_andersonii.AAC.1
MPLLVASSRPGRRSPSGDWLPRRAARAKVWPTTPMLTWPPCRRASRRARPQLGPRCRSQPDAKGSGAS